MGIVGKASKDGSKLLGKEFGSHSPSSTGMWSQVCWPQSRSRCLSFVSAAIVLAQFPTQNKTSHHANKKTTLIRDPEFFGRPTESIYNHERGRTYLGRRRTRSEAEYSLTGSH